jgi:hypothetical protein
MIQAISRPEVDFTIANLGSIVALTPMTAKAREACEDGTIVFEDWQVMGGSIMVERRCAADLIENLRDDGFVIADE